MTKAQPTTTNPSPPSSSLPWQKRCSYWLPPLVWVAILWLLSAQPVLPGPKVYLWDFLFKKGAHMFMYAGLYGWWWRALTMSARAKADYQLAEKNRRWWQITNDQPMKVALKIGRWTVPIWLMAFILTLICAIGDELHQAFVPGRTNTVRDVGFDLIGALGAAGVIYGVI